MKVVRLSLEDTLWYSKYASSFNYAALLYLMAWEFSAIWLIRILISL